MPLSVPPARSVDLRIEPVDDVLDRVESSLNVLLDRGSAVRKRRSIGARTQRGTWVCIERRSLDRIRNHGWDGIERAEALRGITKPAWYAGVAWRDPEDAVMWRADETELLPDEPIGSSVVAVAPDLPDRWWTALNSSLDALAEQRTNRIATPDTENVTQELVTEIIGGVFAEVTDTTVEHWRLAHADLNWANVTAPEFCLFDWEDWGMAPRGLDAASLWGASLAVPALAERVRMERRHDFESRDGKLMTLFVCAKMLGPYAHFEDPRLEPARRMADHLVNELRSG